MNGRPSWLESSCTKTKSQGGLWGSARRSYQAIPACGEDGSTSKFIEINVEKGLNEASNASDTSLTVSFIVFFSIAKSSTGFPLLYNSHLVRL